jgi:glycosyltransferase involved in cell wall biosynthesis
MPLHVLQLGPVPPPEGGISQHIRAVRRELAKAGARSSVIATSKSEEVRSEEGIYYPRTAAEFLAALRSVRSDILHLHVGGTVGFRVLAMALACATLGHGKKVLTMHSGGFAATPAARSAKAFSFTGFVFRRFTKVIAVNDRLADVFRRFGLDDNDIETILPFALAPPSISVSLPEDLRKFSDAHSPLLVSVGGMEKDYEPFLQIDALREIKAEYPNAGLAIVGGGSMMREVTKYIADAGLSDSVFAAGSIDHDLVLQLVRKADIMLRITLFDGDAISVREALFLGTPVVATDNEMRPPGTDLVPIGNRAALVKAVGCLLKSPPDKPTRLPAADNSNIQKVVELYQELAGKKS